MPLEGHVKEKWRTRSTLMCACITPSQRVLAHTHAATTTATFRIVPPHQRVLTHTHATTTTTTYRIVPPHQRSRRGAYIVASHSQAPSLTDTLCVVRSITSGQHLWATPLGITFWLQQTSTGGGAATCSPMASAVLWCVGCPLRTAATLRGCKCRPSSRQACRQQTRLIRTPIGCAWYSHPRQALW